jgi:hypothetical protein
MGIKVIRNGHTRQGGVVQSPRVGISAQQGDQGARRRRQVERVPLPTPTPILLSILIPTVPGRETKLYSLLAGLDAQVRTAPDVELLVLRDNRGMTIGEKRNRMIQIARGDYVVFVDDDDAVTTDYVGVITEKLRVERPDVLCFSVTVRGHGPEKPCRYHPDFEHQNLPTGYTRKPNHLMPWRRDLALAVPFPALKVGEDTNWAAAIAPKAAKIATIARALYTYQYDVDDNSATAR